MVLTAMMDPTWRYSFACGLEQAVWRGGACAALSPHFHQQTQITIVIAGMRRFATRFGLIQVSGGQTAILPAGMPHQALGLAAGGGESVQYLCAGHAHIDPGTWDPDGHVDTAVGPTPC